MIKPVITATTLVTEDGVPIDAIHLPGPEDLSAPTHRRTPRLCKPQARPGSEWTTTQIACTGSPALFRYSCGVAESKAIESPGPSS